jgi:F-type H+-transporting ATPase subunit b
MRKNKQVVLCGCYLITIISALYLFGTEALAAENTKTWRTTFDLVMRWLNFAIITFVIVKFAKKPLKDFLLSKKEEINRNIKKYKQQKEKVEEKIKTTSKALEDSMTRFEKLKRRIIQAGEKKKEQIIEDAQQESIILIESAKQKIENQILEAKNVIRAELIESAIALAEARLPEVITAKDQQTLIANFMQSTAGR